MAGHEIQSETGTHTDGVQKSLALDPKKTSTYSDLVETSQFHILCRSK